MAVLLVTGTDAGVGKTAVTAAVAAAVAASDASVAVLKAALSWMPLTRITVTAATTRTAGRLNSDPVSTNRSAAASQRHGDSRSASGSCRPTLSSTFWK